MGQKGIVAAGHPETARAATQILELGGNAFDAALAALCAACVAEPLLASLGGGGFLLAKSEDRGAEIYDFFVQTPRHKPREGEVDFYPIQADFGTAQQEFHIGLGSMAVPGVVAGLFEIHQRLCRLPLAEICGPAMNLARHGVEVNEFQHYISQILLPILNAAPEAMALAAAGRPGDSIASAGERVVHPDMADSFAALIEAGPDLFYRGEWADRLVRDCTDRGGLLCRQDLDEYEVQIRDPIRFRSHGARFLLNSLPSPSGVLVAFAMGLLDSESLAKQPWGSSRHCLALLRAMRTTGAMRRRLGLERGAPFETALNILDAEQIEYWREEMWQAPLATRGTTHISVADQSGNLASLTISNGEGCAYVLPGTGIMLNNMLGEEDLSPEGFFSWRPNKRMASMMCPSIVELPDGRQVALGSGGSNRIRSAILQVLLNVFEFGMTLDQAVQAPRMHIEDGILNVEAGFQLSAIAGLSADYEHICNWPEPNLYFGGVHAVERLPDGRLGGAGDSRRGGSVAIAN